MSIWDKGDAGGSGGEGDLAERVRRLEEKVSNLYAIVERGEPTFAGPGEVSDGVQALVRENRLIEAIKLHREQTGQSLAEAQAAVETWRASG